MASILSSFLVEGIVSFVLILATLTWRFDLNLSLDVKLLSWPPSIAHCFWFFSLVINGAWYNLRCSFYGWSHMVEFSKMSAPSVLYSGWPYKSFLASHSVASLVLSYTHTVCTSLLWLLCRLPQSILPFFYCYIGCSNKRLACNLQLCFPWTRLTNFKSFRILNDFSDWAETWYSSSTCWGASSLQVSSISSK